MHRVLLAAIAGLLMLTTPAAASSTLPPAVHFEQGPGILAKVTVIIGEGSGNHRIEVLRQGQVIGQRPLTGGGGTVVVPNLVSGDVANLYAGETLRYSAAYDGTPTIEGACSGRSSFTFSRGRL